MLPAPDSLQLLGAFHLIHRGAPVTLGQTRLEELVALLASRPCVPVTRIQIAHHFWADSSEKQARTNTRNLLYKLKKAWPGAEEAIVIDRSQVIWYEDAAIQVDVQRFEALCAQAEENEDAERVRLLAAAVDAYQGDLLPDCYADWALAARERLRSRYAVALAALIDALLDRRQYKAALERARQLRDHDPLQESTYRQLMQVHAAMGDRASALRTYHACASMLHKELGVEPAAATQRLHARLLEHVTSASQEEASPQAVQRPRLIGRHDEWRQLRQTWREAEQGQARCVIIWGEAGMGKTRLAEELLDWVQRQGRVWASSRSYAMEGALTYAPITEWLRSPRMRPALETIDDLWRVEVARLLPDLLAKRPDLPPPGPLTESWQQQRFFQGVIHALQAAPGPRLLHLDDMQWSDAETLTLLHFLLYSARSHPLLVVGGIRTEDAGDNAALASMLKALRHGGQLAEIRLAPLSREEVTELAAQTAGEAIAPDVADSLFTASEGHPFYLIESVRSGLTPATAPPIFAGRMATRSALHGVSEIPSRIYDLIATRLGQLSPEAHQVANMAAVIGRDFTYETLRATLSMDELPLVDALDELWTRRMVREQGGDGYDFSHDRIREVAYAEISRARRRLLHKRVAEALESLHPHDLDSVAGELAAHYALAGKRENAFRYYRQAANVALAQHALAHAEAMCDAALIHAPDDPLVRLELLQEQHTILRYSLNMDRWQENLGARAALLTALPTPDPRLRLKIELDRSWYFSTISQGDKAVHAARAAIDVAQELEDEAALAQGHHELGYAFWGQTRMAEAGRHFERSTAYAQAAGEPAIEAQSLELYAATGMFTGMPGEQILGLLTRSFDLAETNGDKLRMASLLNKLGYCRVILGVGDFTRAEQEYQRGLALAREVGHLGQAEMILSNLGVLFTHQGDYRQALNALNDGLRMGEAAPEYNRFWITRHYLGRYLMQIGRLDSARAKLTEASERLCQIGNRHFEVLARSDLGLLYLLADDHGQAQDELTYVLALIENHGDLRFEALVSTRLGYALEALGQPDDARRMYVRGRDLHERMEQRYYAMNALAGSARVADWQGDHATALAHVRTIWGTIAGQEMDATVETARTLRTCYTIFLENNDPRAADVMNMALAQLHRRAETIDEPEHVTQFWQLADHSFFQKVAVGLR